MESDAEPVLRRLGRRVAELRKARGWTQEGMAELLDVTPRYVQAIEAGGENLSVGSLVRLAKVLRVRLPALFERPASMTRKAGRPKKA